MSGGFWQWLEARAARRHELELIDARRDPEPSLADRFLPQDFRGWLALGLFLQSVGLFAAIVFSAKELSGNQGFMTLAAAVIVTGWIGGAVAFAYAAGKGDSESRAIVNRAMGLAEDRQRGGGTTTVDELSEPEKAEIERLIAEETPEALAAMARDIPDAAGKTDPRELATAIVKARRAV